MGQEVKPVKSIIFLDFDGVIATPKSYLAHKGMGRSTTYPYLLDLECCEVLDTLCQKISAGIVISSTWRRSHTYEEFKKIFADVGITAPLLGRTRKDRGTGDPRGLQIRAWMDDMEYKGPYLVIDDEVCDIRPYITPNHILYVEGGWTVRYGLTLAHIQPHINSQR